MTKNLRTALSGACLAAALWLTGAANAAVIQITVDTSSASGTPAWVIFDLTDGDASNNSSVAISDFAPVAGLGPTVLTVGGVTGALPTVTLTDSSVLNEYMQDITLGSSLSFTFDVTGTMTSGTPDGFAFFLLARCDNTLTDPTAANGCVEFEPVLQPTGPNGELFLYDVGRGFFTGKPYNDLVTPTELPEPGSLALGMVALLAIGATGRGKRRV